MQSYFSPYVAIKKGIIFGKPLEKVPKTEISVDKYETPAEFLNISLCWSLYYVVWSSVS